MALKRKDPVVGSDVKRCYLTGGLWNRRRLDKEGKGRSSPCKLARVYIAKPPATGWPGGMPEQNGYRPGGKG
jgi:hypothetical protein